MPKYAFLDLDGTLVRTNLAHVSVHHQSRRQTLSGRAAALIGLATTSPMLIALDRVSRSAFQELLYAGFHSLHMDRLRWLGEHAAEHVYEANLRGGTRTFLARLRQADLEPVLVTGSLLHVVAPFAKRMGIQHYTANQLEIRDGRSTGRLVPPIMSGAQKARWMREFADANGAHLSECHAYSDSAADLPMLAMVGHPCAVHPDRALRLEAHSNHWPVIDLEGGRPVAEPLIVSAD